MAEMVLLVLMVFRVSKALQVEMVFKVLQVGGLKYLHMQIYLVHLNLELILILENLV
jgi:hypothetical protein